MKVIIIEDEQPALDKIVHYLKRYDANSEVIATGQTISEAVKVLNAYADQADLLLMDIHLADGLSFFALDQVEVHKPVIFITAYNQYALEAFKANGIDYLLKPITFEAFVASLNKLKQIGASFQHAGALENLSTAFRQPTFKERFMIKIGDYIHSVPTSQVVLFYAEGRNSFLVRADGRSFITDYKLETLEELLSPEAFFRVNRSYIIGLSGIKDVLVYSNSRLKINTLIPFKEEIIVSRERVNRFKDWFGGGLGK